HRLFAFLVLALCLLSFNVPPTTEIYTLSLHDALPIFYGRMATSERTSDRPCANQGAQRHAREFVVGRLVHEDDRQDGGAAGTRRDRKSTRLNSSHQIISYAVFCLKKKNINSEPTTVRS